jgi:hypothetical protein
MIIKLPESYRFRYLSDKFSGKDKELKLKWIEEVNSKEKDSLINLIIKYPAEFLTLPDAFLVCNSEEDIDKADLSKKVKVITIKLLRDFGKWKKGIK